MNHQHPFVNTDMILEVFILTLEILIYHRRQQKGSKTGQNSKERKMKEKFTPVRQELS